MSRSKDGQARGQYTLEFKQEAVRLVKGGQSVPVTVKILGIPEQTLGNWVRLSKQSRPTGAGDKPVSAEQMELARLRAENGARHLKKSDGVLCAGNSVKYAWIAHHKARWPVTLIYEVLEASASGYFEQWRRKSADKPTQPEASQRIADAALLVHIRVIHAEVKAEYGWPRM